MLYKSLLRGKKMKKSKYVKSKNIKRKNRKVAAAFSRVCFV